MGRRRHESHLYRRPDSRVWWCWYYEPSGRLVRVSTRCTSKEAARAVLADLELRARDPAHRAAYKTTLGRALAELVDERRDIRKRAPGTVSMYESKAQHLTRVLGADTPLGQVVARSVDAYVVTRVEEGAARSTIGKELTTLRSALKLAKRRGEYTRDIAETMPAFSAASTPRRRFLTPVELRLLLAELAPDHAARVAFIVAVGARWIESERAQRRDVQRDRVVLRGSKTAGAARTVPILPATLVPSRKLLDHAQRHAGGRDGRLFAPWSNVRRDLRDACERAGIDPVSPNDLRRTLATWLRARGVAPSLIGAYLGHADGRMVERVYGRLPADELAAAITGRREKPVRESKRAGGTMGTMGKLPRPRKTAKQQKKSVPRDGIEPSTRGFSVLTVVAGNAA